MKKIVLSLALFLGANSFAQDYNQGIGVGMAYGIFSAPNESGAVGAPGVVYKASLGWEVGRDNGFAISAYPFLGFSGVFGSRDGAEGSIAFELPLNAEYYFGDMTDRCFFVGAGFNYLLAGSGGEFGGLSGKVVGPQIALGGQFEFKGQLIGLRAGYTLGVTKPKFAIAGEKYSSHGISVGLYRLF